MRATISRCLHTLKQRRSSDEGFSLIELIVVVAILGILVAIAIPVFTGLQNTAAENATKAAAANAATQVASQLASGGTAATPADDAEGFSYVFDPATPLPTEVDAVCVKATGQKYWAKAGPACKGDAFGSVGSAPATTPPAGQG